MRITTTLLVAALLPSATWSQSTKPAAPNSAALVDRRLAPEMGMTFCRHTMDAATFVDALARNVSGEQAFVMRWLDPKGIAVHTALYAGRCITEDGDIIDGKEIARVLPNSLSVSDRHGLTAWEGEYWDSPNERAVGSKPRRGVFNDSRFVAELDPIKAAEPGGNGNPDFRWNQEQETLTIRPDVVALPELFLYHDFSSPAPQNNVPAPKPQPAPPQVSPPAPPPNCPPKPQENVRVNVPKKASAWACKTLGICPGDKPVIVTETGPCPVPGVIIQPR